MVKHWFCYPDFMTHDEFLYVSVASSKVVILSFAAFPLQKKNRFNVNQFSTEIITMMCLAILFDLPLGTAWISSCATPQLGAKKLCNTFRHDMGMWHLSLSRSHSPHPDLTRRREGEQSGGAVGQFEPAHQPSDGALLNAPRNMYGRMTRFRPEIDLQLEVYFWFDEILIWGIFQLCARLCSLTRHKLSERVKPDLHSGYG